MLESKDFSNSFPRKYLFYFFMLQKIKLQEDWRKQAELRNYQIVGKNLDFNYQHFLPIRFWNLNAFMPSWTEATCCFKLPFREQV